MSIRDLDKLNLIWWLTFRHKTICETASKNTTHFKSDSKIIIFLPRLSLNTASKYAWRHLMLTSLGNWEIGESRQDKDSLDDSTRCPRENVVGTLVSDDVTSILTLRNFKDILSHINSKKKNCSNVNFKIQQIGLCIRRLRNLNASQKTQYGLTSRKKNLFLGLLCVTWKSGYPLSSLLKSRSLSVSILHLLCWIVGRAGYKESSEDRINWVLNLLTFFVIKMWSYQDVKLPKRKVTKM